MAELSVVGSHYGGLGAHAFDGISDLEIYERDGIKYVLIANEGTGRLQIYRAHDDQVMTYEDLESAKETTGSFTLSDVEVLRINGQDVVLTSGRYDDNAALISLSQFGIRFQSHENVTGDAEDYANFTRTLAVVMGDKTFVFAAKRNDGHLHRYLVQDDRQFIEQPATADSDDLALGDISDMVSMVIDGKTFIAVTSAFDGGVSLFRISENGVLAHRDTVFPAAPVGFRYPQELSVVQSAGQEFLVMTSAGSSSITVYTVSGSGQLRQVDHQIDTLDTRFEGADQVASIEHEGRSFIFVAGNDDGITVFELLPDGTLLHAITLADDFDIALTNVSAISVTIINGEIHVFVAGAEDGITQFIFEPDTLGTTEVGTTGKDVITGTGFDDHLFGGRRGDTIDGGAGDDRIDGGGGKDYLTGGAGADTFVFVADGRKDFIMDFEDGLDLIDLSGYHQIGTVDDLTLKTREWGVLIEIRGEKLKVIAADGETITAEDFTADDFIF